MNSSAIFFQLDIKNTSKCFFAVNDNFTSCTWSWTSFSHYTSRCSGLKTTFGGNWACYARLQGARKSPAIFGAFRAVLGLFSCLNSTHESWYFDLTWKTLWNDFFWNPNCTSHHDQNVVLKNALFPTWLATWHLHAPPLKLYCGFVRRRYFFGVYFTCCALSVNSANTAGRGLRGVYSESCSVELFRYFSQKFAKLRYYGEIFYVLLLRKSYSRKCNFFWPISPHPRLCTS